MNNRKPLTLYESISNNPSDFVLIDDYTSKNTEYDDFARYLPPLASFIQNKFDMDTNNKINKSLNKNYVDGTDKYFHAKTNCQSGQNAIRNALMGLNSDDGYNTLKQILFLDYGKEIFDLMDKNHFNKRNDYSTNHLDSKKDIEADHRGLWQGLYHPFTDCRQLLEDIDMRTEGVNKQY